MSEAVAEGVNVHTRKLSFSIQGEFVTELARERAYQEMNFPWAIDMLMSCMKTDTLSQADILARAMAILDGRKELRGRYPGPDYGLYDVPEEERSPRLGIKKLFEKYRAQEQETQEKLKELQEKLQYVADLLPESKLREIDRRFAKDYHGEYESDTIFGTNLPEPDALPVMTIMAGIKQPGEDLKAPIPVTKPEDMLQSYLDRMQSATDEPDYGWLFPDGTFYAVEWGEHRGWAYDWLEEHRPEVLEKLGINAQSRADDALSQHTGAVLVHSPYMGIGEIQKSDRTELTQAQKDFMYDYYIKRGQNARADAIFQEG